MTNSVSIIVPVYKGGKKFLQCFDSIEQCIPPPLEVIVVIDGEGKRPYCFVEKRGHRLLALGKNSGPAVARNQGAGIAKGDILLFIDSDVVVEKDIIARVQATFHEHKGLAALMGSYDDEPFEPDTISQYRNLLHHFTHQTSKSDASTFWGACGAIKRDVFMSMQGFDPSYSRPSIEDIEFGYRLRNSGHAIRLEKNIRVKHLKKWTFSSMLKTDIFQRALPWSELIFKHQKMMNDLNLSINSRLSTICVFLLCILLPYSLFPLPYRATALILCVASSMLLLLFNKDFYSFLIASRGYFFFLKSIPLHWLYFFYSGACFLFVITNELQPVSGVVAASAAFSLPRRLIWQPWCAARISG